VIINLQIMEIFCNDGISEFYICINSILCSCFQILIGGVFRTTLNYYFCIMRILCFWKPALWLIFILTLSLIPGNKLPGIPIFPHFDKVVHAAMYFGLSILLIKPLRENIVSRYYLWTLLICLVIGSLVELFQEYLALNRSGSWLDGMANISGAILGILLYHYLIRGNWWEKFA
jgi:VanZ family protein